VEANSAMTLTTSFPNQASMVRVIAITVMVMIIDLEAHIGISLLNFLKCSVGSHDEASL
jgi:hypothetical protein